MNLKSQYRKSKLFKKILKNNMWKHKQNNNLMNPKKSYRKIKHQPLKSN